MEKSSQQALQQKLQQINQRIQLLENENKILRTEIQSLKHLPEIRPKTTQQNSHKPTQTHPELKKPGKVEILPTPKVTKKNQIQKKQIIEKQTQLTKKEQGEIHPKQQKKPIVKPQNPKTAEKKHIEQTQKINSEKKVEEKPKIHPTPKPQKKQEKKEEKKDTKKDTKKQQIKPKPTTSGKTVNKNIPATESKVVNKKDTKKIETEKPHGQEIKKQEPQKLHAEVEVKKQEHQKPHQQQPLKKQESQHPVQNNNVEPVVHVEQKVYQQKQEVVPDQESQIKNNEQHLI